MTIKRLGLPDVDVRVDGVVELPQADSLFQAVGVPANVAPQAPPDNVLLLPLAEWHQIFDPQGVVRPDSVHIQLHLRIGKTLPVDPGAAYTFVQELGNNVEARIAGFGLVGNNLAARLDGVRADALYARLLFLFLGLPGAIVAALLTFAVAASGSGRRRQEQALLRTRGASTTRLLRLAALEALVVGLIGVVAGALVATVITRVIAPTNLLDRTAIGWTVGAAVIGLAVAIAAVLVPAWSQARHQTIVASRRVIERAQSPLWQRTGLDILVLIASAVMFWRSASTGYQVVLAPEGVAQTAVSYESLLAPLCLWLGAGLLAIRLCGQGLARGRRGLARLLTPLAGSLAGVVAASLGRQRTLMTRGVILVALAFSFATSTAIFNTTYNAQARVDAELTNGADVSVIGTTAAPPSALFDQLKALPGVAAAEMMQHRFAYVGADLQDMYGIDPQHIGAATTIANAYFANGNARATLATLAAQPDGVLVSEETVKDFQLSVGDQINLRLLDARDHQYHVVPFHFVGITREFPTAPKDSFLVANTSYVAQQSGSPAAEIVLLRAVGSPAELAARVRPVVQPVAGARVTDIDSAQHTISSSLTAVDLSGLTWLELSFAVLFVAAAAGLILALGLADRRRTFAILAALGAKPNQLGAFLWSEGALILVGGALIGVVLGAGVAQMLVKVLTGVFDPPPETLTIPWSYLAILIVTSSVSTAAAVIGTQIVSRQPLVEVLRDI